MKVTLVQEVGASKEIVVRFAAMDDEVRAVLELLSLREQRLAVNDGGVLRLIDPPEVLYCESVDDHTFVYTASGVYGVGQTLTAIAEAFERLRFFRCSRSMVVNLTAVETLKSAANGRIIATLTNGERILVSRRYAGALRKRLKGEKEA